MTTKETINNILSKHPEITRQQILDKLQREKRKTDDLISDEVLLRKIAAEIGVDTSKEITTPALSIQDLIPGLNDVSVVGRVVAVFPPRTFEGRRSGKVASLLIVDRNSILRVILWNDKADYIESRQVKNGKIICASHGYTRKGYRGKLELHLGERGVIQTNPENVNPEDYPTISKFVTKISEITPAYTNKNVNLTGIVEEVFPVSSFEREDSSCGKVMRLKLADKTGDISVVVWNQKVNELERKLEKGDNLRVVNARVKEAMNEGLEIHVNSGTYVEMLEPFEEIWEIADLKLGLNHVKVKGEVVTKPTIRKVKTSRGGLVRLAVFELKDETGRIWVSAWREHAKTAKDLEVGQKVTLEDAYVKKGFGDQPELSTRKATAISEIPNLPPKRARGHKQTSR